MDTSLLYKEKSFLNHQFPTITALNDPPTVYEGMIRCEKGKVKSLAQEKIWPFTEYVSWQRFRLELPREYPLKPPIVIWMTDISHPNIVTNIPGAVCNSLLGEDWKPNLRLVSVVNALYFLLSDPNPNNVFDHKSCLKAAEICRKYNFPLRKVQKDNKGNQGIAHFNILPIPKPSEIQKPGDAVQFTILGGKKE